MLQEGVGLNTGHIFSILSESKRVLTGSQSGAKEKIKVTKCGFETFNIGSAYSIEKCYNKWRKTIFFLQYMFTFRCSLFDLNILKT